MTSTNSHADATRAVVVGVDGTAAGDNAARYACEEAARCGIGVKVVHVVPTYVAMSPTDPLPPERLMEAGRSVLRSVMSRLESTTHDVHLEPITLRGGIVATLNTVPGAHSIVVGSDRRSVAARILTGNVSTGVAASASVPTVSVPETWRPRRRQGVVLAAVKHHDHADDLLAEAFAVAQERGSRLVVVHAWRMPSAYDDVIADRVAYDDWDSRARHEIEQMLVPWRRRHPDVDVELRAMHDQPAHALVSASEDADELVLVRRAHGIPAAAHLGATARSVLLHSHCPVRIVPPGYRREAPDVELEAAGAMLK